MEKIDQTLMSVEVAEMIGKEHSKLLRDIRRYIEQFNEAKMGFADFFKESTYIDAKGETRPCYRITKKGCEFIAHKLTGTKGTIFTAQYINRFHEMQDILSNKQTELIKKKELLTNRIIQSIVEVNEALRDTEDSNLLTWIFQDIALLSGSIANIERLRRGEKI